MVAQRRIALLTLHDGREHRLVTAKDATQAHLDSLLPSLALKGSEIMN